MARDLSEFLHIKVSPQDIKAIELLAERRELTKSDIVREAIRAYLAARVAA